MHNNYFLQIQTLINQKAIGAPTKKEESKPAAGKTEPKKQIEKICKNCNEPFFTENPKKDTCSYKCRSAYSRRTR